MMRVRSILRTGCLLAAAACLALGYHLTRDWLLLLGIPLMILFWIATGRQSSFWVACSLLTMYVVVAAMGITRHGPALPLAAGCVFALAAWDLSDPRGYATAKAQFYGDLLEKSHLRLLGWVVGISTLLIVLATVVRVKLPFGVILLLSLLSTGCILYAVQQMKHSKRADQ